MFFWNGLWDAAFSAAAEACAWGFNPCFSGMAFGTPSSADDAVTVLEFQSLFFWNGLWDVDTCGEVLTLGEFQSLFFWNGLWDFFLDDGGGHTLLKFQSLFFWNGLWDYSP